MAIFVRTLSEEERRTLDALAHSRTAPVREVERAKIIWLSAQNLRGPAIAQRLGLHEQTVRDWLKRFNAHGLSGLNDLPRPGKPPTYTPEEHSEVIATALRNPQELDLPFASWTLDRLQIYLQEHKSIGIKRSRIDELLLAEGLRWRTKEALPFDDLFNRLKHQHVTEDEETVREVLNLLGSDHYSPFA